MWILKMTSQTHNGIGDNININGNLIYSALQKYPTILADIINILGTVLLYQDDFTFNNYKEYAISQKIEYNNLIRYRDIIDENKIYQGKLNAIYQEIENSGSPKKTILLKNISDCYSKIKGKYIFENQSQDPIEVIRNNSDNIFTDIENELLSEVDRSNNIKAPLEEIKIGILIIMVAAFIDCKILEEPKNASIK